MVMGIAGKNARVSLCLNDAFVERRNWTPLRGCLSSLGEHLAQPTACRGTEATAGPGCSWPLTFGVSSGNGIAGPL